MIEGVELHRSFSWEFLWVFSFRFLQGLIENGRGNGSNMKCGFFVVGFFILFCLCCCMVYIDLGGRDFGETVRREEEEFVEKHAWGYNVQAVSGGERMRGGDNGELGYGSFSFYFSFI